MKETMTFEQLPQAVTTLTQEIKELKELVTNKQQNQSTKATEKLLTVKQAAKFLNLKVPTIYSKVNRKELPYMKRGKRLYFSDVELLAYLKEGRNKTNAEIEAIAAAHVANNSF